MRYRDDIKTRMTARFLFSRDFCGDLKDKKVIDIGCSNGWFEYLALKEGVGSIVGIDVNERMIEKAKQEVKKAKFLVSSALTLPLKEKTFDLVVMFEVIEHLPKNTEVKALKEARRLLKRDGLLCVSVPNSHFLAKLLDPAWWIIGHRHYSKEKFSKILKKAGFEIIESKYGGGLIELLSMIGLYFFKWVLRMEIPFKKTVEKYRKKEYANHPKAFSTLFIKARPKR